MGRAVVSPVKRWVKMQQMRPVHFILNWFKSKKPWEHQHLGQIRAGVPQGEMENVVEMGLRNSLQGPTVIAGIGCVTKFKVSC